MLSRRDGLRAALAFTLSWVAVDGGTTAAAQQAGDTERPRLALKGYDPVAYFTDGRPVAGKPEFEAIWDDVRYRFASLEHMKLFEGDPERYAPQYAGSCAGAMSLGLKIEANPESWVISDGRLFVFADAQPPSHISPEDVAAADKNWRLLEEKPMGTDLRQ